MAEGREGRGQGTLPRKFFQVTRQILHSGTFGIVSHELHKYVFAFRAWGSGPAKLGNSTRSTRYAMLRSAVRGHGTHVQSTKNIRGKLGGQGRPCSDGLAESAVAS